jgi:hypothetical protein
LSRTRAAWTRTGLKKLDKEIATTKKELDDQRKKSIDKLSKIDLKPEKKA